MLKEKEIVYDEKKNSIIHLLEKTQPRKHEYSFRLGMKKKKKENTSIHIYINMYSSVFFQIAKRNNPLKIIEQFFFTLWDSDKYYQSSSEYSWEYW